MRYDKDSFTFGAELEFADVYRFDKLPSGSQWNEKDYTIVNSSGIANDPKGELWKYGGEINTKPTGKITDQVGVIEKIIVYMTHKPAINYRCNLHLHVGVPGLSKDLKFLKQLLIYIDKYCKQAFVLIEPIPKPIEVDFEHKEAYKGAMVRYRRRRISHQYMVPEKKVRKILEAKNVREFWDGHAAVNNDTGELMWYITPRAAINLRQIFETDTIEFRHFPGTLDFDEYYSCLLWVREFTNAALNDHNIRPIDIYKRYYKKWKFPKFRRYIHDIDLIWRRTNLNKNSRKEVKKAIAEIKSNYLLLNESEYRKIGNQLESGYPSKSSGIRKWI